MRIVGVDTGGTFTDLVFQEQGEWRVFKLLSTPDNPARAVLEGLGELLERTGGGGFGFVVHGSTVATNAILERKGSRTGLVTNAGFEDVLAIGRQNRGRLYDLAYAKELPLAPGELRVGVQGRVLHTGEEQTPFDVFGAEEAAERLLDAGAESVAVCFLFSFLRPEHERRMGEIVARAAGRRGKVVPVSLSHEILSEFREFERTSTTVVNAYVSPKMLGYITHLTDHLEAGEEHAKLRIMQSNGGSISADTARREPVRTILSGPAGGVVGARALGRAAGCEKLITFDMGGTSTDVSLVNGGVSLTLEAEVAGFPVKTPMIDIHTVGAGGGSIAALDSGGALTVGPESAGADPGPVCYGTGERITVTDANLFLGRIIPDHFLGGEMALKPERLEEPFGAMAREAGLTPEELAEGILDVANAGMERAIRVISVERGFNPGDFTLFSFGGAGGLHAAHLARLLHISTVLIPGNPGILSALGMLLADVVKDYSQTVMLEADQELGADSLAGMFEPLERDGRGDLEREGIAPENVVLERLLDMRYQGQSFEIVTPFGPDFVESFHALHERTYGYRNREKPVEVVNIRLRAKGSPPKPRLREMEMHGPEVADKARLGTRQTIFEGKGLETLVLDREALLPGNEVQGPAVLVEYSSTLLVPPFARARVDCFGNLFLDIN